MRTVPERCSRRIQGCAGVGRRTTHLAGSADAASASPALRLRPGYGLDMNLILGNNLVAISDEEGAVMRTRRRDDEEEIFRFWPGDPLIMASMQLYDADGNRTAVLNRNAWNFNDGSYDIDTNPRHLALRRNNLTVVELEQLWGEDGLVVRYMDVYTKQRCRLVVEQDTGDFVVSDRRGLEMVRLTRCHFIDSPTIIVRPYSAGPPVVGGPDIALSFGHYGTHFRDSSFKRHDFAQAVTG